MSLKMRIKNLEQYAPVNQSKRDIEATRRRCEAIIKYCDDPNQVSNCKSIVDRIDNGTYRVDPLPTDADTRAAIMHQRMIKLFG